MQPRRFALGFAVLGCACRGGEAQTLYVVAGGEPEDRVEFRPRSSYAQYLELPNLHRELRITLSSVETHCEDNASSGEQGASVAVLLLAPSGTAIEPGTYPWAGHAAHEGTDQQPEHPYAFPSVRLGRRSVFFEPGGEIELGPVPTELGGKVTGLLSFEFAGDAEHPATSLKGQFSASLCRVHL